MTGPKTRQVYEFGGYRLEPLRRVLSRGNGAPISLKPKVFDTLLYLVEHAGETLAKGVLMDAIWPNVVVEEHNLSKNISVLRHVLGETPEEHRFIVTEPGRGYRFVAEVSSVDAPHGDPARIYGGASTGGRRTNRWALALVASVAVFVAAGLFVVLGEYGAENTGEPIAALAERGLRSIAVLPFTDLSEESDREWLSDGFSLGVLDLLGKIPEVQVTPQLSAFSFKGKDASIGEIAEILNVDHVLDGQVHSTERQLRVTVQLNEARTNTQTWSEQYEGTMSDVFAIQGMIAADVVEQLHITLLGPGPAVDDETTPEVYALYQEARHITRNLLSDSFPLARELLEEAVERDPNYLPARLALSLIYANLPNVGALNPSEARRLSKETFDEAADRWPNRREIIAERAWIAFARDGNLEAAARDFERLLAADPDDVYIGLVPFLQALNRPEKAVEVGEYIVLRNPICGLCYANLAHAYLASGQYDQVEQVFLRARALSLVSSGSNRNLRIAYAASLLLDGDAKATLEQLEALSGLAGPAFQRFVLTWSAMAHYALGQEAQFEAKFRELTDRVGEGGHSYRAAVYAYIGDVYSAFEVLNTAFASDKLQAVNPVPFSSSGPFDLPPLDAMRDHPGWPDLAAKAGIWPDDPRDKISFEVRLPE